MFVLFQLFLSRSCLEKTAVAFVILIHENTIICMLIKLLFLMDKLIVSV